MTPKRIELPSGGWAEIREEISAGAIRYQREEAMKRGFFDSTLDNMNLVEKQLTSWSFPEQIDRDGIDVRDADDIRVLVDVLAGPDPNASPPSSGGTGTDEGQTQESPLEHG